MMRVTSSWFNLCPPCEGDGVTIVAGNLTVDRWLSLGMSSVADAGAMVEVGGARGTDKALRKGKEEQ